MYIYNKYLILCSVCDKPRNKMSCECMAFCFKDCEYQTHIISYEICIYHIKPHSRLLVECSLPVRDAQGSIPGRGRVIKARNKMSCECMAFCFKDCQYQNHIISYEKIIYHSKPHSSLLVECSL